MLKYKQFITKKFLKISTAIAIIVAIITAAYLVVESFIPINDKQIYKCNQQLQLLKEDFNYLESFENATSEVVDDITVVTFKEKRCIMQCFFDKDGRYVYYTLRDARISNNFAASLLAIIVSFSGTLLFMTIVELILYIPIVINEVYKKVKNQKRIFSMKGS